MKMGRGAADLRSARSPPDSRQCVIDLAGLRTDQVEVGTGTWRIASISRASCAGWAQQRRRPASASGSEDGGTPVKIF